MNEVDESNATANQRLVRIGREIEKCRLERAFLLENLAKRTSTNVEDSEGSPSPPPTVSLALQLCSFKLIQTTNSPPSYSPRKSHFVRNVVTVNPPFFKKHPVLEQRLVAGLLLLKLSPTPILINLQPLNPNQMATELVQVVALRTHSMSTVAKKGNLLLRMRQKLIAFWLKDGSD